MAAKLTLEMKVSWVNSLNTLGGPDAKGPASMLTEPQLVAPMVFVGLLCSFQSGYEPIWVLVNVDTEQVVAWATHEMHSC